jgi:hypothetical protein
MEYSSAVYRELRHNHLARIGIWLIDRLLPMSPSADSDTYRKRWTERLQKDSGEYLKDEANNDIIEGIKTSRATVGGTKPSLSFSSTISSRTMVDEDAATSYSAPSRGSTRSSGLRSKNMEKDSLAGGRWMPAERNTVRQGHSRR